MGKVCARRVCPCMPVSGEGGHRVSHGIGAQTVLLGYLRNDDLRRHKDLAEGKQKMFVFDNPGTT